MIQENEIRNAVVNYLAGEQSLDEFEDWLAQRSWNMHLDSDPGAQDLVGKIELALAEYSNGHKSERGLRNELRSLVETCRVVIGSASSVIMTTAFSSSEIRPSQVFDIRISEVFS